MKQLPNDIYSLFTTHKEFIEKFNSDDILIISTHEFELFDLNFVFPQNRYKCINCKFTCADIINIRWNTYYKIESKNILSCDECIIKNIIE